MHFPKLSLFVLLTSSVLFVSCGKGDSLENMAMFRGDPAHSAIYRSHPVGKRNLKWQFKTGGYVYSSAAISGGIAFFGSADSCLYAVHIDDGTEKWRYKAEGTVHSSPAVYRKTVFFGAYDGKFYALDAETGSPRWTFRTEGERKFRAPGIHGLEPRDQVIEDDWDTFLSSPVLSGGIVYFGSGDGNVYALDVDTGEERWRFATGEVVHSSPAISNEKVFVGSWDSYLYALDAHSGNEIWKFQTGVDTVYYNQVGIQSSPVIADSIVYFGCRDSHLYALDAETGEPLWNYYAGGSWIISSPVVANGRVYFGTSDTHRFLALDAKTGHTLFDVDTEMYVFSSPSIVEGEVYLGTFNGKLLAFSTETGERLWEYQVEAGKTDPFDVLDEGGRLRPEVFSSRNYADAAETYARIISTGSILSSPVIDDGILYFGSADGNLYALH